MSENEGAAAPATEQATTSAPATTEQATPPTTSVPTENAAPENAETTAQETAKPAPEGDEGSQEPKRLTRQQRLQRKAARLSTVVAEQAAEIERLRQATAKPDSEPKEADFNGDYFAWQRAVAKWDAEQVVKSALSKALPEKKELGPREINAGEVIEDLRERIEAAQEHLPDFKQSLAGLQQHVGDLSAHVLEELGESDKGEFILYHLAKNPQLAASLNRMSERDAAREIARLEAKVSLPQPKKQTQAPAPLTSLKGGASPSKDIRDLAKQDDLTAYIKARNEEDAARRR